MYSHPTYIISSNEGQRLFCLHLRVLVVPPSREKLLQCGGSACRLSTPLVDDVVGPHEVDQRDAGLQIDAAL